MAPVCAGWPAASFNRPWNTKNQSSIWNSSHKHAIMMVIILFCSTCNVSRADTKKTRSSACFGVYTFNSLVKKSVHLSWCCALTDSWNSGSFAAASQRLFNINMFGLDKRFETSWKNDFSYKKLNHTQSVLFDGSNMIDRMNRLTAKVIVDSAFKTRTNTSALRQWLSIQSFKFAETSTPGESTNTTSSRSKLHRSRGQNIRIFELSLSFSWHNALANCWRLCKWEISQPHNQYSPEWKSARLTVTFNFSSESSLTK